MGGGRKEPVGRRRRTALYMVICGCEEDCHASRFLRMKAGRAAVCVGGGRRRDFNVRI